MALSTFVKISGITNLSDARYCAGMYVDLLGFSLEEKSDKYVHPTQFAEITGWVSGLEFAGEFETMKSDEVLKLVQDYPGVTWIEHSSIKELIDLIDKGYGLIFKLNLDEVSGISHDDLELLKGKRVIFNLTKNDEELSREDKAFIFDLSQEAKVILGAGISADSIHKTLEEFGLAGIALAGGEEIKPGLKDFDELADILEALETEE